MSTKTYKLNGNIAVSAATVITAVIYLVSAITFLLVPFLLIIDWVRLKIWKDAEPLFSTTYTNTDSGGP